MSNLKAIKDVSYNERRIISVFTGEKKHDDDELKQYPFMTLCMELEEYNQLSVKMPRFLIGQQFDIITISYEVECGECLYCDGWDKRPKRCKQTTTEVCGEFIFHIMPHELFFKVTKI